MKFLTAQEAQLLANLGAHYHGSAVAENLTRVLDTIRTIALQGKRETKLHDFTKDLDLSDLINALRTLGYNAKAICHGDAHIIDVSW